MFKQLVKLFICSSVLLSSTGVIFATAQPTQASEEIDQLWRNYFGGRMIVHYSSYSSGGGGGGTSSRSAQHFCSNGAYAAGSSSSIIINTDGSSLSSSDSDSSTGTWQIVQSGVLENRNSIGVIVQLNLSNGETKQIAYELRKDRRLYTARGTKLLTGASDVCQ
jgi:hypothetical protein